MSPAVRTIVVDGFNYNLTVKDGVITRKTICISSDLTAESELELEFFTLFGDFTHIVINSISDGEYVIKHADAVINSIAHNCKGLLYLRLVDYVSSGDSIKQIILNCVKLDTLSISALLTLEEADFISIFSVPNTLTDLWIASLSRIEQTTAGHIVSEVITPNLKICGLFQLVSYPEFGDVTFYHSQIPVSSKRKVKWQREWPDEIE